MDANEDLYRLPIRVDDVPSPSSVRGKVDAVVMALAVGVLLLAIGVLTVILSTR